MGCRKAYFDDGFTDVFVYDGVQLAPGSRIDGPAIVEQATTTIVVQPGYQLMCDDFGNYLVYRQDMGLEACIARLKRGD
jgi:N-methylhydantoinase A